MDTLAYIFCGVAALAAIYAGITTWFMQRRLRRIIAPALPNVLVGVGLVQLALPIAALLVMDALGWRTAAFIISLLSIAISVYLLRQGPRLARAIRDRVEGE